MSILFNKKGITNLQIGSTIKGEWNHNEYFVVSLLGNGENGAVYLVKSQDNLYALKISDKSLDLSNEIHMINKIKHTQGQYLGFSIFDVDDFILDHFTYSFYVMPYQRGISLDKYLNGKGQAEYVYMFKKILSILKLIHEQGWVYGDLKPEHILIEPKTKKISLIDFGGLTLVERGVRQYTEIYDRGSWKAGTRKADFHYDMFSLVMIFLKIAIGKNKFLGLYNHPRSMMEVYDIIRNIKVLQPLKSIFIKVLKGQWKDTEKVLFELDQVVVEKNASIQYQWIDLLLIASFTMFSAMIMLFIYI